MDLEEARQAASQTPERQGKNNTAVQEQACETVYI